MKIQKPTIIRIAGILSVAGLFLVAPTFTQTSSGAAGVFLKAFYPLDEPRFHCVDIPGHKARVNVERPLSVHTCKEGIWHNDE